MDTAKGSTRRYRKYLACMIFSYHVGFLMFFVFELVGLDPVLFLAAEGSIHTCITNQSSLMLVFSIDFTRALANWCSHHCDTVHIPLPYLLSSGRITNEQFCTHWF